jgi:hypothetical protein
MSRELFVDQPLRFVVAELDTTFSQVFEIGIYNEIEATTNFKKEKCKIWRQPFS